MTMVQTNYSNKYTYTIIVNIRFANDVIEKLCRYTCDINLNPMDKIMDKLKTTLINKDGAPTLEFANWIIENHPEFKTSDVLDKNSIIFFEFVDLLPTIKI